MLNLAIGGLGIWEIVILAGILLLLFGAKKLPELARSMGSSITQFKKGLSDAEGGGVEKLPPGSTKDDPYKPTAEARREGARE